MNGHSYLLGIIIRKRKKEKKKRTLLAVQNGNSSYFSSTDLLQPEILVHTNHPSLYGQITINCFKCNFSIFLHKDNLMKLLWRTLQQFYINAYHIKQNFEKAQ